MAIRSSPSVSSAVRKIYVDCAVQTDFAESPYWDDLDPPPKRVKKPYTSLTKRLLLRCQRDRRRLEARQGDGLNGPNESPNVGQEPSSSNFVQPTAYRPSDEDVNITSEDSKVEVENVVVLPPENLSFRVPLQKPRPPSQMPNDPDQEIPMAHIKIPSLPSPLLETQLSLTLHHPNGNFSEDSPAQPPPPPPPPPPHVSDEPATKSAAATILSPISTRPPAVQTSNINHVSLPTNAANSANVVQPSPIRKKLSLAEYLNIVNTNKTETHPPPDPQALSSPILQSSPQKTVIKPDVQATKVIATTGGAVPCSKRDDEEPLNADKDPKL